MNKTEYIVEFEYIIGCNMAILTLNEYGYIHDNGGCLFIEMIWYRLN